MVFSLRQNSKRPDFGWVFSPPPWLFAWICHPPLPSERCPLFSGGSAPNQGFARTPPPPVDTRPGPSPGPPFVANSMSTWPSRGTDPQAVLRCSRIELMCRVLGFRGARCTRLHILLSLLGIPHLDTNRKDGSDIWCWVRASVSFYGQKNTLCDNHNHRCVFVKNRKYSKSASFIKHPQKYFPIHSQRWKFLYF